MFDQGFYHYYKVMDRAMSRKTDEPVLDVGVVYLMGTIGESGDFDAGSVGTVIKVLHILPINLTFHPS